MKKFASGSTLAYQASVCGETQQSRYKPSNVGNSNDGNTDTLATAGAAKMLLNTLTLPYEVSPQSLELQDFKP
jgi:hypothetical protein